MKTKIQIKNIAGKILYEYKNGNATIKDAVVAAVKEKIDLSKAYLYGIDLSRVDLHGANLREAYLYGVDLSQSDLHKANLYGVNLRRAYLYKTNLSGTNLRRADLYGADLRKADLSETCLHGAILSEVNFRETYFNKADLREANLRGACVYGSNIREAKNIPYIPLECPSDGSFIGWKKVCNHLVKLKIPEDAKRSSATTYKCRCDKAKVLAITDYDGNNPIDEIKNTSQRHHVTYKVGEMVYPDSFDEDRWNECSHGIHFFINKQDAINY